MDSVSSIAVWSSRIAVAGLVLFVLGPVLAQIGAPPELGFRIFGLGGVLLAFVALILGAVGLWATRPAVGRGGRGQARTGALLGFVLLSTTLVAAAVSSVAKGGAAALPAINDITTNPGDPPAFAKVAALEANSGRDMAYPGPEFAEQQRQAYPGLAPIALPMPTDKAFQECRDTALELGWTLVDQDPAKGLIEASDSTALFRFVDDIVIRVRPAAGGGTVVDVRSKSRAGRGDLGANAGRIRTFRDALEG
jgi:uncharacterized protein (DUF1499 family)